MRIQCPSHYSHFSRSPSEFMWQFEREISCFISGNLLWLPALQQHMQSFVSAPPGDKQDPGVPDSCPPLLWPGLRAWSARHRHRHRASAEDRSDIWLLKEWVMDAWMCLWSLGKNAHLTSKTFARDSRGSLLSSASQRHSFSLRGFFIHKWGVDRDN